MLKLGAYGILRLMVFRFSCFFYIRFLLRRLGLMGVFLICFSIFRYLDIRVLVAYSSIVHMGFVLVSFLYGFEFGVLGGNFMLLAHGLCSSALFYVLSLRYECYFRRRLVLVRGGLILSPVLSY